jgi:hypothetical protein
MSVEYFVVTNQGTIVNCITSESKARALDALKGYVNNKNLHLETDPSQAALEAYEFWDKRP